MNAIRRASAVFCKVELWLTAASLLAIATLVFVSAIARTVGRPLNWATDISLLLFAWMVFLGGDIVVRETNMISVDLLKNKFPLWLQKTLNIIFYLAILAFLVVLVAESRPLLVRNWKRLFQVLPISYGWCTLSVTVGSALMFISTCIRLVKTIRPSKPALDREGK
mgnify:CR=1 FL=1